MKKIIIIVSILAIIAVVVFGISNITASAYTTGEYKGSIYEATTEEDSYADYIKNEDTSAPITNISIDPLVGYTFDILDGEETTEKITYDGIDGLYIPEIGKVSWNINVVTEGYYNISITYYAVEGRSSSIYRGLEINDYYPFVEAKSFVLSRIWKDEFDVSSKRVTGKHDIKPSQVENPRWNTETIRDTEGYYGTSYSFYFGEGINKITLVGVREPVVISAIELFKEDTLLSYNDLSSMREKSNIKKCASENIEYKVQGESSYEKSSPSLTPTANYLTNTVEPYENFITRYNTIGGTNWNISGDWITWQVNVKEAGLYQITCKSLQNYQRGMQTSRKIYINNELQFEECKQVSFNYESSWHNYTLGDSNGAYWFYFNEGVNTITLESTIGVYGPTVKIVNEIIANLNWIYRKAIMKTGVSPSKYQDYQLYETIKGLKETIQKTYDDLVICIDNVVNIAGERSNLISSLDRSRYQLENFLESEKKIQVGLSELESNITSLGTWVTTISEQPLAIDYILVHGENAVLPKANPNFFSKVWHEIILLIGSYGADTSLKSSVSVDGPTITVWIMTGRDQSTLLRQLIDESFTMQYGINVDLKLVSSTVLLPATLSGNGPDVAIGVSQNIPVNWGIRSSVVDVSKLAGFDEYIKNFHSSALVPFTFGGATYAIPDTQDFQVTFVRTDIFEELGLVDASGKVVTPTNWDEVIDLLPILQRQYLDYYLPNVTGALSPLLYSMICQYGGSLYLNNGAESGMMLKGSSEAFYDFVDFYRSNGFAIDASFANRFRTGEMPIGVANFSLYNTLSVSAPEIRGNWEFASLPGYLDEDGILHEASTATCTGSIILSGSSEIDAAWEFVKWWDSKEAQLNYARGMEAILGAAARYPTANLEAFASLPWSVKDYRMLEKQRQKAVGVEVVPGDYIVGRYIDNAFRQVINDDVNPSDSLYNYYQKINIELTRKRKEFNLD